MQLIPLTKELSIKELDPTNPKERWIVQQLEHDEMVIKYLNIFKYLLQAVQFLDAPKEQYLDTPFLIWKNQNPIGYIEASYIKSNSFSNLSAAQLNYALCKSKRGKGYATQTVKEFTSLLLNDFDLVQLTIDHDNQKSQKVADQSGFIYERSIIDSACQKQLKIYQKTK